MMEKTVRRGTRTGFTTGACSAAAAAAAVQGLVHGTVPDAVDCLLPNGDAVRFAVHDGRCDGTTAHAMVIKDAGDDPDCTDKAHLTADVCTLPGQPGVVCLRGGFGIGTVTMAGLGLEVGGPAITFADIAPEVAGVYPRIMQDGDMEAGVWSCGMVAGLIHDVPTVQQLIDSIMAQADALISERLAGLLRPAA